MLLLEFKDVHLILGNRWEFGCGFRVDYICENDYNYR